jgi:hypothetical protein
MSKEIFDRSLIIDSRGRVETVPYPTINSPIDVQIKRPKITTYEQGLEWNIEAQKHTEDAVSFTQEYAKVHVEPHGNKIYAVNLSDLHWGHKDVDYALVDHLLSTVEKTPDTYAIFGWNILDAAIPAQFPDGVMWSSQTAQEQVYTFRDKLQKLHRQNKILGAIGDASCHEGWMRRKTGWMIYRELFEGIDVPLMLNGSYLDIEVGKQNYRMGLFHAIKYWSQFNKTHGGDRAMDRIVDAEIVFSSHLHQAAVGQTNRYNPPFTKETAVVSSGTCKVHDRWYRGIAGKDGETAGQGIILWKDRHAFQVIYNVDTGKELMSIR